MRLGLGVVFEERSFFHKNEWNYQERSHHSEKRMERKERVLKNIGMERRRTEKNGTDISLKERLKSGTCSKSGTHLKSGMYAKSSRNH